MYARNASKYAQAAVTGGATVNTVEEVTQAVLPGSEGERLFEIISTKILDTVGKVAASTLGELGVEVNCWSELT